ncbi:hypothetical protein F5Y15DRAFT_211698 [Xylariaceae sp. FL0016]|nr:hypothetical protein F5Y15DRAFT_211698 [Xylariaceae sp. FL0016]
MATRRAAVGLAIVNFVLSGTTAAPLSNFPINSQLPPVARVSTPFSWTFSPSTFSSSLETTYTLSSGPSWLSIDSTTRTLSGTPRAADAAAAGVLGVPISITATDATGSTTANSTLVVTADPAPEVAIPLEEQIPQFGAYSAPSSVLLYSSRDFSFAFEQDTFSVPGDSGAQLNYYATSRDSSPLPSWISFDPSTLSFTGKTPLLQSPVESQQTFNYQLVASDVVGFSATSIPFSIVVGLHELTADESVIALNATATKPFVYNDLPTILKLDEKPLTGDDVKNITAEGLPPWLSFDSTSWTISGTPDANSTDVDVTIEVFDKYTDKLNVTLAISLAQGIFVSDIPDVNVTAGKQLNFGLERYLSHPMDTTVTFDSEPQAPWVHFDGSSMTLSGSVPEDLHDEVIRITFNATIKDSSTSESKTLSLHADEMSAEAAPSPSPTQTANSIADDKSRSHRDLLWLLVLPVLAIFAFIIILLLRARKRRQSPKPIDIGEISRPLKGSFLFVAGIGNGANDESMHDLRKLLDIGPPTNSISIPDAKGRGSREVHLGGGVYAPARTTNWQESQAASGNSSREKDTAPHAITMYSGEIPTKLCEDTIGETTESWFEGQTGFPPQGRRGIGESDGSTPRRYVNEGPYRGNMLLDVPIITEPFSIQATPELAYTAGKEKNKYEYSSDDEVPPPVGYPRRPISGQRQDTGPGLRDVGHRLSKVWKRGSILGNKKRESSMTSSTGVTTRTSILINGVGIAEGARTTITNVVTKPTVIHIPSRLSEARHVSRRAGESSPLFRGRLLTRRNFGCDDAGSPGPATEPTAQPSRPIPDLVVSESRDSDISWDPLARGSLGVAYRDLMQPQKDKPDFLPSDDQVAGRGVPDSEKWQTHHTSQELMSPDKWPIPDALVGLAVVPPDSSRSRSELSRLPSLTPTAKMEAPRPLATSGNKGKGHTRNAHRTSAESMSDSWKSHTPSSSHSSRGQRRSLSERQLRISKIREQRALDEVRVMMSQTPSPTNEWPAPAATLRPLPETPTRPPRGPLTDRMNGSNTSSGGRGALGLRSALSRRSQRTLNRIKSMGGVRSMRAEEDDEDAWEDIRPSESTTGGWDDGTLASFSSVYI